MTLTKLHLLQQLKAALEEFDEVVQAQIDQAPLNPDTTK